MSRPSQLHLQQAAAASNKTKQSPHPAPAPAASKSQAKFELGVSLVLFQWPALSLAVQNQWGGSDSEGKREWFVGAITDMFAAERPDADLEDVETTLLQVMMDEFEVNVDDDTAFDAAQHIMRLRASTLQLDFREVDELYAAWVAKKGQKIPLPFHAVQSEEQEEVDDDEDAESSEDDEEDDEDEMDLDLAESTTAPQRLTEKAPPEVDSEGFVKVGGRHRR
ncbi:MAG: hypothetical protein M1826_006215 [Phylliscum demangeonii]|nr:MAG: hypothetical protein M1826_006215 [Phylliscum demangeonii]